VHLLHICTWSCIICNFLIQLHVHVELYHDKFVVNMLVGQLDAYPLHGLPYRHMSKLLEHVRHVRMHTLTMCVRYAARLCPVVYRPIYNYMWNIWLSPYVRTRRSCLDILGQANVRTLHTIRITDYIYGFQVYNSLPARQTKLTMSSLDLALRLD
jgi:hypothetical protein